MPDSKNNKHIAIPKDLKEELDKKKHTGQSYAGFIWELLRMSEKVENKSHES